MHPMIRALGRHRLPVALLVIEVALVCGVAANTLHLLGQYATRASVESGVDREGLAWLRTVGGASKGAPSAEEDLNALRRTAGVSHAAIVSALPLTGISAYTFKVSPPLAGAGAVSAGMYFWGPDSVSATGVRLIEGRNFQPDEHVDYTFFGSAPPPASILITKALATRLFGASSAVGQRIHLHLPGDPSATVVGVIERLAPPSLRFKGEDSYNVVLPVTRVPGGIYAVRLASDRALRRAENALYAVDASRVITKSERFADTEHQYFRGAKSMVYTLASLTGCMVLLMVVGIVAISNYWVVQRRKSIGVRRAVGASRAAILRYFLIENALLVACGGVVGAFGAVGINFCLMKSFEVDRLPLIWIPVGWVLVVSIGLSAVVYPAIKASRINISAISATD